MSEIKEEIPEDEIENVDSTSKKRTQSTSSSLSEFSGPMIKRLKVSLINLKVFNLKG